MLSKRARGYDEAMPEQKRFRHNLADAFLTSGLSGARTQSLFDDAHAAGAANLRDLGGRPLPAGKKPRSNVARDLTRRLMKGSGWPKPYQAELRVKNPKTDEVYSLISYLFKKTLRSGWGGNDLHQSHP